MSRPCPGDARCVDSLVRQLCRHVVPAQDELQLQCDSLLQWGGRDALVMSISTRALEGKINGAWCDAAKAYEGFYICEGVI